MGRTRYTSGCYSEAGRAAKNQDAYSLFDVTLPDGGSGPRRTVKVAIAADGINGHQGGEIASQNAVAVIKSTFTLLDVPMLDRMQRAIQQANRAIYDQSLKDPKVRGMGCTVVMAVLDAEKLYLANVGDSRSYLVRGGIAHQLTEDHTRMESSQSSTPQLTRRLGRTSRVNIDLGCIPLGSSGNNYVDRVSSIDLQQGDALLLCTDGLTNELADDYIQQIVSNARSPQAAAQQLVAKAKAAGATDDITALVVRWPDPTRRNVWLLGLLLVLGLLWFNFDNINTYWEPPLQTRLYQYVLDNEQYPGFSRLSSLLKPLPAPTVTSTAMPTATPTNTSSPTPIATPSATNTLIPAPIIAPATATVQPTFTATTVNTSMPTQTPVPAIPIVTPTPRPTATHTPTATPTFTQNPIALPALTPATSTITRTQDQTGTFAVAITSTVAITPTVVVTSSPTIITEARSADDCSNIPDAKTLQVSLTSPPNDSAGSGLQTFSWSGPVLSQQGDDIICAYELFFYQAGQDPVKSGFGWAGTTFMPTKSFRLNAGLTPPPIPNTTYLWGVRLVTTGGKYQILRLLSEGQQRTFRYEVLD